jgi:hypothetical protein
MVEELFVPADFAVPDGLVTQQFRLEPLGPEHNVRDYAAWSSSVEHIRATPGFDRGWPHDMTLQDNRRDLERHAKDFAKRVGFTYSVLELEGDEVIGCVYIYPASDRVPNARIASWVRADRAKLDLPLWRAVSEWLAAVWPFARVDYAARSMADSDE